MPDSRSSLGPAPRSAGQAQQDRQSSIRRSSRPPSQRRISDHWRSSIARSTAIVGYAPHYSRELLASVASWSGVRLAGDQAEEFGSLLRRLSSNSSRSASLARNQQTARTSGASMPRLNSRSNSPPRAASTLKPAPRLDFRPAAAHVLPIPAGPSSTPRGACPWRCCPAASTEPTRPSLEKP